MTGHAETDGDVARRVLDSAHDAFVSLDESGLVTAWNARAETMFGWPRQHVLGQELAGFLVPEVDREPHRRGIARLVGTGVERAPGRRRELMALHRDGYEFLIELTLTTLESQDGYTLHGFLRDITERRSAAQALALARDQALEASRMKSMFVANVSHEIRTPMNGVIGMTDLLLQTSLTAEQRDYAETISASGEALLVIIDDILDLSKIEAGKLLLDPTDFDLRDAIERVTGILAGQARRNRVELAVAIEPAVPRLVHGDGDRLRQVVTNLGSNAIKFTAGGEVAVRVAAGSVDEEPAIVRIEVADTGIGIERAALEKLFKPFTQADGSTTRKYGGTGLGLAISRHLVEMMGGRIGAESEFGRGSTFWVEVPLGRATPVTAGERPAAGRADPPATVARATVPGGIGPLVLVVEDNPVNQRVAALMLERRGYRVEIAENGRRALEALAERSYAAALMDVQMPELDGYETTRAIRGRERPGRRIPIIAMTANAMQGERERCLAAGMDDYLTKPLRSGSLEDALTKWISSAHRSGVDPAASGRAAAPDGGGGLELLHEAVIADLEELDETTLGDLLRVYFYEAGVDLSKLAEAVGRGDVRSVGEGAHRMKGASSTVGAARVAAIAGVLEAAARAGDLAAGPRLLDELRAGVADTRSAFDNRLAASVRDR